MAYFSPGVPDRKPKQKEPPLVFARHMLATADSAGEHV